MLDQTNNAPERANELQGDLNALTEQLGSAEGLLELSLATARAARVQTVADLEQFLVYYRTSVLLPRELPTVTRSYDHCARGHVRELIALDREIELGFESVDLAAASSAVGRMQLRRLRPLRGERLIQHYLAAVEKGEARAWHTVVFGLVLAVYSIPLRQGLMHFGVQTLGGFIEGARPRLNSMTPADVQRLTCFQSDAVKVAVEQLLADRSVF